MSCFSSCSTSVTLPQNTKVRFVLRRLHVYLSVFSYSSTRYFIESKCGVLRYTLDIGCIYLHWSSEAMSLCHFWNRNGAEQFFLGFCFDLWNTNGNITFGNWRIVKYYLVHVYDFVYLVLYFGYSLVRKERHGSICIVCPKFYVGKFRWINILKQEICVTLNLLFWGLTAGFLLIQYLIVCTVESLSLF